MDQQNSPELIEQKIREQRLIEATKRGYTGRNGKLQLIVFTLGQPMIDHSEGGAYVDRTYLPSYDDYDLDDGVESARNQDELLQKIPIMDAGDERLTSPEWTQLPDGSPVAINKIGHYFDGLDRGMHMTIKYDDLESSITVTHRGYEVYKEIRGELVAYRPINEWENWIDRLYKVARKKNRQEKEIEFQESVKEAEKIKTNWLEEMRKRWGL